MLGEVLLRFHTKRWKHSTFIHHASLMGSTRVIAPPAHTFVRRYSSHRDVSHKHRHRMLWNACGFIVVCIRFTTGQDEPKPEDVVQRLNANPDQHVWDLLENAKSRRIRTPVSLWLLHQASRRESYHARLLSESTLEKTPACPPTFMHF